MFQRFTNLIARNLHCSYKEIVKNNTFSLNAISNLKFHKMSAFSTSSEKSSSVNLSGIFPPIVTPFQDNEDISYDKLTENFNKWKDVPFRGDMMCNFCDRRRIVLFYSATSVPGGQRGTPDFKWQGWSNGGKDQNTKKYLGLETEPQKSLDQNSTPNNSHAKFLSHKNFQNALQQHLSTTIQQQQYLYFALYLITYMKEKKKNIYIYVFSSQFSRKGERYKTRNRNISFGEGGNSLWGCVAEWGHIFMTGWTIMESNFW